MAKPIKTKPKARKPDAVLSAEEGLKVESNAPSKIDFGISLNFAEKPKAVASKRKTIDNKGNERNN